MNVPMIDLGPIPTPVEVHPLPKLTERDMLDRLTTRYSAPSQGNTIRYSRAEHVRSAAGFGGMDLRTADFVAMDLWPSKKLALHGHEVKVSRSDWLTELKHPEKSAAFRPFMDYWWLVVSDLSIVKGGELPVGWGLMYVAGTQLRVKVPAPRIEPLPLPRTMLAALLRSTQITAERVTARSLKETA